MTRRRSGSAGKSRGRQLAKAVVFGLGGAALAVLVVKTSVAYALVDLNPYAVSRIAPDDPRVPLNIALIEFTLRNGALTDRTRDRAYQALAKAPLAETPMLIAAVSALAAGDEEKGEKLLVEARHRDPRFLLARLLLLNRYLTTDRVAESGEEIAVLARLAPETGSLLVPQLATMAANPRTGTTLMHVLGRDPKLQQQVLAKLASTASPELVQRLAREAPPAPGTSTEWQGLLLGRLVGSGDYRRAYGLWRSFAGLAGDPGESKSVYDGRFQNLPGAPPFNWQLTGSAAGVAERNHDGGLQVQYFGRDGGELAAQLLLLSPGSYRLLVRADGDASGEGARLGWTLDCVQTKARLAELPMVKVNATPKLFATSFSVPAGCSAQWLRLSGKPAEFPTEQDAVIREIRVERAGA